MTEKIEVIEFTNPQKEAVCRGFHCGICGKQHLKSGELALIWFVKTEVSHFASKVCVPFKTPVWERG
jgi:hypothetical protein